MRPHNSVTLTNCDFEKGFQIDVQDGTNAVVTLVDCTYNGKAITAKNVTNLIYEADDAAEVAFFVVK